MHHKEFKEFNVQTNLFDELGRTLLTRDRLYELRDARALPLLDVSRRQAVIDRKQLGRLLPGERQLVVGVERGRRREDASVDSDTVAKGRACKWNG